jgi:hypothetical protein
MERLGLLLPQACQDAAWRLIRHVLAKLGSVVLACAGCTTIHIRRLSSCSANPKITVGKGSYAPNGISLLMFEERSILKTASSSMHLSLTLRPSNGKKKPSRDCRKRMPLQAILTNDVALLLSANPLGDASRKSALARPHILAKSLHVSSTSS